MICYNNIIQDGSPFWARMSSSEFADDGMRSPGPAAKLDELEYSQDRGKILHTRNRKS